jgi:ABC-type enterobactin transport system permease subunit
VYANRKVTSITETVTTYTPAATGISEAEFNALDINVFPNPASDLIAVQVGALVKSEIQISLYDMVGKKIATASINAGQTIAFFDTQTLYDGMYVVTIENGKNIFSKKVVINKD